MARLYFSISQNLFWWFRLSWLGYVSTWRCRFGVAGRGYCSESVCIRMFEAVAMCGSVPPGSKNVSLHVANFFLRHSLQGRKGKCLFKSLPQISLLLKMVRKGGVCNLCHFEWTHISSLLATVPYFHCLCLPCHLCIAIQMHTFRDCSTYLHVACLVWHACSSKLTWPFSLTCQKHIERSLASHRILLLSPSVPLPQI